ncbi:Cyclic di-GMP phosphodiesterase Gmr [Thalassocella blandensis]|nr:Cyclic di-GMP phosphodiesterase Gmr [Thalassocella blandensis]
MELRKAHSLQTAVSLGAHGIDDNNELRNLLDAMRSIIIYLDRWGVIQHCNIQAQYWCGQQKVQGLSFKEFAQYWDDASERQREIMQVIRTKRPIWQSLERSLFNGKESWYSVDKIPVRNSDGMVTGALLVISDVTAQVKQQRALQESESRYRAFIANSSDAIWCYDIFPPVDIRLPFDEQVSQILWRAELSECNEKLAYLFGAQKRQDLIGTPLHINDSIANKRDIRHFVENNYRLEECEFAITNKNGQAMLLQTSAVGDVENGYLKRCWGMSRDVTEYKQYLDKMEHMANHDGLTSLPNRTYLYQCIEAGLRDRRHRQKMALLLIDLDRFKEINDTLGHLAGDRVLKQLGPRLELELADTSGVIARLGGDEFAIFLPNIRNTQQVVVLAHRFLDAICQEFDLDGVRTEISASIGIAVAPDQANDVTTLLRYADIAMYHAKNGLKGVAIYDASYDAHSPMRLEIMGALGRAIREHQLSLHFQPKVDLNSHRVYGFESLLRWEHPELGFIPPNDFIPIAEMSSAIYSLTNWVLEETVKQAAAWIGQGYNISVAMNLSARNLLDDRIVVDLSRVLKKYKLDGRHLEMEITESMIMSDPQRAQVILEKINALGVVLSVDDFGTGYSSLGYLKRLPVKTLKIDSSFVQNMLDDEQDEIIVNSTIQLAHNLGLKVVAEGVETQEIYDRLAQMGCDAVQGYFIAKPMAEGNANGWLQRGEWNGTDRSVKPL